MRESLRAFFESYQRSWDALDGSAIARHYHPSANILDGDGLNSFATLDELVDKFQRNCDAFRDLGYGGSEWVEGACVESGGTSATVDLGWRVSLREGSREFRTTYSCVQLDDGWQILHASAYAGDA